MQLMLQAEIFPLVCFLLTSHRDTLLSGKQSAFNDCRVTTLNQTAKLNCLAEIDSEEKDDGISIEARRRIRRDLCGQGCD